MVFRIEKKCKDDFEILEWEFQDVLIPLRTNQNVIAEISDSKFQNRPYIFFFDPKYHKVSISDYSTGTIFSKSISIPYRKVCELGL